MSLHTQAGYSLAVSAFQLCQWNCHGLSLSLLRLDLLRRPGKPEYRRWS
jgi:hypothetical protein